MRIKKIFPLKFNFNKKIYYHLLYICLIAIAIGIFFYSVKNITYISGEQLANDVQVIVVKDSMDQTVESKVKNEKLGIFASKIIKVNDLQTNEKVFNTFKLENLVEYQNYSYNLKFKIKGLATNDELIVGSQPHEFVIKDNQEQPTGEYSFDLTKSQRFHKGSTNEINVKLDVTANQKGKAYIYIGIVPDGSTLDYELSNITLVQQ